MWLSLTASTVMVQFFQTVTLALGGTLLTSLGATSIFGLSGTLATLLVCLALLYLILCMSGIVHRFALRPMMAAAWVAKSFFWEGEGTRVSTTVFPCAEDISPRYCKYCSCVQ